MKKTLEYNGKTLVYDLSDKNVKNINLRIQRDGAVVVSKNKRISQEQVDSFLLSKWDWIFSGIDRMKKAERIQSRPTDLLSIRYFGRVLPIVEKRGAKRLVIKDDSVEFYTLEIDIEKKITELQKHLERNFTQYIEEIKVKYDGIVADYGLHSPPIKYRYLKGKWGSCDTRKKIITMNYNLMYYPKEATEYVLLHEYLHLIVPNHSKRFHDLMKYHQPDYKKREELLKAII